MPECRFHKSTAQSIDDIAVSSLIRPEPHAPTPGTCSMSQNDQFILIVGGV